MKEFKMNKINQVVLGTIIGVASINSYAQNELVAKDPSLMPSVKEVKSTSDSMNRVTVNGSVTQVGTVSSQASHNKLLKGFAKDLPLITVMKQITPNGWIVKKNDTEGNKVDIQKPVSWEGGKTWIETLTVISKTYNLNALVNWDEKAITLSNASILVPKAKKSVFEIETNTPSQVTDVVAGSSEQPVVEAKAKPAVVHAPVVVTPIKQAPVQQVWEISSAKSLKENVIAWGEKAGYRVVWTGDDYGVVDSRIMAGAFDAENGPIKQLSEDYGPESRAQNPLSFQFYQNKTLVVENLMYEQSGYSQYSQKN